MPRLLFLKLRPAVREESAAVLFNLPILGGFCQIAYWEQALDHAKLLNHAWELFGKSVNWQRLGLRNVLSIQQHRGSSASVQECFLAADLLSKSHCNKQISLPKTDPFATKEDLLLRLGIQRFSINFNGF